MNFNLFNKSAILSVIAALSAVMMSSTAFASCTGNNNPELVRNPGFESGTTGTVGGGTTIPNWTVFDTSDTHLGVSNTVKYGGTQSLFFASIGGNNRISQKITTTAGSVYTVCFHLAPEDGTGTSDFRAQWNNQDMIVLKNSGIPNGGNTFTYYQFSAVATGDDVLSFEGRNDPSSTYLDNVEAQLCVDCGITSEAIRANKPTFTSFKH